MNVIQPVLSRGCRRNHFQELTETGVLKIDEYSNKICRGLSWSVLTTTQAREKIVSQALKGQTQKAAVYVQGMVCTSCAIGVRVHLKKIDAVDRKQKNKGVTLHPDGQLAYIDLKAGKKLDPAQVSEAIKKAGYKPVSLYVWNGKKVEKTQL